MSASIEVIPERSLLLPGESIQVRVVVKLDVPLKVRCIVAEFEGTERTKADYTKEVNGRRKTVTAKEVNMLCAETFVLFGENKGAMSRLADSAASWFGGGSAEEMAAGEHEYSFQVSIPNDAPPSFVGMRCERGYRVKLRVDVPIKFDPTKTEALRVISNEQVEESKPVHVIYPDDTGKSLLDRAFGKKVRLNLALDQDQLTPGHQVLGMLVVESDDPLEVNQIKASLCGLESVRAEGHSDSHLHRHELAKIESPGLISKESTFEFSMDIPESVDPPTESGKRFNVKWWIEIRLHVPWAKDPTMKIPITLLSKQN